MRDIIKALLRRENVQRIEETPSLPDKIPPQETPPLRVTQETRKGDIMKLELLRYSSQKETTLGLLFNNTQGREFLCYTLEDEFQTSKVYAETRIPAGTYKIILRKEGGFHQKYSEKFGSAHKGMLWLQGVPNFEYVLIHIGNKDDDTAGCLLVGDSSGQNITEEGFIGYSTAAYQRIYPPIAKALENGDEVKIEIIDFDLV